MALTNGPKLGILVNGAAGESHYAELMRQWRAIDLLVQPVVESIATTPPAGVDGLAVLVGAAADLDFTGQDGKIARYNSLATAWEFFTPGAGWEAWVIALAKKYRFDGIEWTEIVTGSSAPVFPTTVEDATTARLIAAADAGDYLRFTNAAAKTATFQPDATEPLAADSEFHIRNAGAADLTLVAGAGVTLNAPSGGTLVLSVGMTVTVKRVAVDVFDIFGQTVAAP